MFIFPLLDLGKVIKVLGRDGYRQPSIYQGPRTKLFRALVLISSNSIGSAVDIGETKTLFVMHFHFSRNRRAISVCRLCEGQLSLCWKNRELISRCPIHLRHVMCVPSHTEVTKLYKHWLMIKSYHLPPECIATNNSVFLNFLQWSYHHLTCR